MDITAGINYLSNNVFVKLNRWPAQAGLDSNTLARIWQLLDVPYQRHAHHHHHHQADDKTAGLQTSFTKRDENNHRIIQDVYGACHQQEVMGLQQKPCQFVTLREYFV
ncbi:hypothetical protein E2C01_038087 [Portunus trituberculatus]|uniref:Uncharacterized protein n=1 Tax=Portunus trituberculatus TaxID=210409 RepID=A0A5B7FIY9_PORTR|nr:hypothetical protein [Portunus trituberculatus]